MFIYKCLTQPWVLFGMILYYLEILKCLENIIICTDYKYLII